MASGSSDLTLQTPYVVPIDDTDPRILYTPPDAWQTGGRYPEYQNSTHGAKHSFKAEFSFIGTSVAVYGTFGREGSVPPSSTYDIDNGNYTGSFNGQITDPATHNRIFYQSPTLEDKVHYFVIQGEAQGQTRFWLDYILYLPSPDAATASASLLGGPPSTSTGVTAILDTTALLPSSIFNTASAVPPTASTPKTLNSSAIIGGVLGGLIFLALVTATLFFCRRRRSARSYQAQTASDPPPAYPFAQYRIDYSIRKPPQGRHQNPNHSAEAVSTIRTSIISYNPPSSIGIHMPEQEPAAPSSALRISHRDDIAGDQSYYLTGNSSSSTASRGHMVVASPDTDSTFSNIFLPYDDPVAMHHGGQT